MEENLYIRFWFYDIILHILGGVGIAMSIYCFAIFSNIEWIKDNLIWIVIGTLLAGLTWELFEIYFNITGSKLWSRPYYIDTIKDLINDTIGAFFVYSILKSNPKIDK